jgi:phosphatidylglycerophosphatase A
VTESENEPDLEPGMQPPVPRGFLRDPLHLIALGFGAGLVPRLPGTAGTVVGVFAFLGLRYLGTFPYAVAVCVLFALGVWICDRAAAALDTHDHRAIVWDEIVGFLVTMIGAPEGWAWIALGFALFRLFDIWKPWPVRWVDREVPGGLGVMADDIAAGALGLIVLQIIAYVLHG